MLFVFPWPSRLGFKDSTCAIPGTWAVLSTMESQLVFIYLQWIQLYSHTHAHVCMCAHTVCKFKWFQPPHPMSLGSNVSMKQILLIRMLSLGSHGWLMWRFSIHLIAPQLKPTASSGTHYKKLLWTKIKEEIGHVGNWRLCHFNVTHSQGIPPEEFWLYVVFLYTLTLQPNLWICVEFLEQLVISNVSAQIQIVLLLFLYSVPNPQGNI